MERGRLHVRPALLEIDSEFRKLHGDRPAHTHRPIKRVTEVIDRHARCQSP